MPEGDTIHKIATYLEERLAGRRLERGRLARKPRLRLDGRQVARVFARGKHLFVVFDDGVMLRSHLGMNGSWHRYRPGEPWRRPTHRASIELSVDDAVFVCFNAKEVELVRGDGIRDRQLRARLGPDLARAQVDRVSVIRRARGMLEADRPLADVLLDQRVASGIGNVYKSEILFLHGIHPLMPLGSVGDDLLAALYTTASDLLGRNLGGGPRITRFIDDGRGRHWVYGRSGLPCLRCNGRIESARLGRGWRSTYWCGRCQPAVSGP